MEQAKRHTHKHNSALTQTHVPSAYTKASVYPQSHCPTNEAVFECDSECSVFHYCNEGPTSAKCCFTLRQNRLRYSNRSTQLGHLNPQLHFCVILGWQTHSCTTFLCMQKVPGHVHFEVFLKSYLQHLIFLYLLLQVKPLTCVYWDKCMFFSVSPKIVFS